MNKRSRLGLVVFLFWSSLTGQSVELRVTPTGPQRIEGTWFIRGASPSAIRQGLRMCMEQNLLPAQCRSGMLALEIPARSVYVPTFAIDRTEVTAEAYGRCVQANVCAPANGRAPRPEEPIANVTWSDAVRYCEHRGGRLPSEAEWELAARGPGIADRLFPWGEMFNPRLANHGRDGRGDPIDGFRFAAPVGSFPDGASPFGLFDMAGNVWEWTADAFDPDYYEEGPRVNPRGPSLGGERMARGGSWRASGYQLRVSARVPVPAGRALADLGFRCAYDRPD